MFVFYKKRHKERTDKLKELITEGNNYKLLIFIATVVIEIEFRLLEYICTKTRNFNND